MFFIWFTVTSENKTHMRSKFVRKYDNMIQYNKKLNNYIKIRKRKKTKQERK